MSNEEKEVKPAESKVVKSKSSPKKKEKKVTKSIKTDVESKTQPESEIISREISEKSVIKKEVKTESKTKKDEVLDFDWDLIAQNDMYTDKERKDFEKEYEATLTTSMDKQVLDGKVVTITDREVVIDINFKSDGVISFNEFKYNPDLKVGDSVEILVEKQEDKNGQLVLSHRRARVLRAWEKVNVALETGEVVNGQITSRTKGGMIVDVFGIECFLPGSQIDVKPIRDYDDYVGKKMEFKVVKVN